jgi:hypothetical protein
MGLHMRVLPTPLCTPHDVWLYSQRAPLRLRLATLVSAGIAAQSPRRGETRPRRGELPCLAQMCIWHNRGWIKSGPKPADPRVSPATPSRTGREKHVRSARVSSDSPLSLAAPPPPLPSRSLAAPPVTLTASGRCASASSSYSSSVSSPNSSSPSLSFSC